MIEEPYRWVESDREPTRVHRNPACFGKVRLWPLDFVDGILFLTVGRARQKVFEIYDRIAMGAIGHPGDIERLRMAAIELAEHGRFLRARRPMSHCVDWAYYSLSPLMKAAFEQIFGAPYLARMIFAELGRENRPKTFSCAWNTTGAIATNGGTAGGQSATKISVFLVERKIRRI